MGRQKREGLTLLGCDVSVSARAHYAECYEEVFLPLDDRRTEKWRIYGQQYLLIESVALCFLRAYDIPVRHHVKQRSALDDGRSGIERLQLDHSLLQLRIDIGHDVVQHRKIASATDRLRPTRARRIGKAL